MKILRITASGLPLFNETLDMFFYAQQRVMDDDKQNLYSVSDNLYLKCAEAFIGINASGKTSVLKVILLVLGILNNEPINHIETRDILGESEKTEFDIYYYSKTGEICKLKTVITAKKDVSGKVTYEIKEESLWTKKLTANMLKKSITDFSNMQPVMTRGSEEFLPDDVSMIISRNKKNNELTDVVSMLSYTNMNVMPYSENIPGEIIAFLDPTIEKLYFESDRKNPLIHLKFYGKDEIVLNNAVELNSYLSSGTVKGIITFTVAKRILKNGGYLVIDEIENHFNKEIVSTLIRFFIDSRINKNAGTLIYTTHYPEILDEYDRNDSIHIIKNQSGIVVENLASLLKRNDIKKSDAYQSGFLKGTTPRYDTYIKLKKNISESI